MEKYRILLDIILPTENKNYTSSPEFPGYSICCEYTQVCMKGKFVIEKQPYTLDEPEILVEVCFDKSSVFHNHIHLLSELGI